MGKWNIIITMEWNGVRYVYVDTGWERLDEGPNEENQTHDKWNEDEKRQSDACYGFVRGQGSNTHTEYTTRTTKLCMANKLCDGKISEFYWLRFIFVHCAHYQQNARTTEEVHDSIE